MPPSCFVASDNIKAQRPTMCTMSYDVHKVLWCAHGPTMCTRSYDAHNVLQCAQGPVMCTMSYNVHTVLWCAQCPMMFTMSHDGLHQHMQNREYFTCKPNNTLKTKAKTKINNYHFQGVDRDRHIPDQCHDCIFKTWDCLQTKTAVSKPPHQWHT